MKKRRILIICLLVLLGIRLGSSFFFKENESQCVRIPVSFFPFKDKPIIKVEIDGKKYSLLIDLGSSHPIDLRKECLQKIEKEFTGISTYIGIDGHSHLCQSYKLPAVGLSNLTIEEIVGYEENLDFLSHAHTWSSSGIWDSFNDWLAGYTQQGRIGWTIWKEFSCFFDFPHSSLYLAQNLNSLTQATGFLFEEYIKIPIEMEERGIFVSLDTELGLKRFLLDTGATSSILRKTAVGDRVCKTYISSLMAGKQALGTSKFLLWDFSERFPCDGILGVDFFKTHAVCIDFPRKVAYIKSSFQ